MPSADPDDLIDLLHRTNRALSRFETQTEFAAARHDLRILQALGRKARYDAANRTALLAVHVAFGLAIGLSFLRWGVPIGWKLTLAHSPATELVIAAVPIVGAVLLGAGLLAHRDLALEAMGMLILLAWEVTGVFVVRHWIAIAHPGPLQYQVAFYAAPAALMAVHLVTMLVFLREQRRQRQQRRRAGGRRG